MKKIIYAENLTFSYKGKKIIDNQNFEFYEGERIGIVGESGSGKSTFLRLLAGLLSPDEGVINVSGETKSDEIMKKISMVMQDAMIMPLTIRENITLGKEISDEKLNEILKAIKLDAWVSSLEKGVDTYLGDRANELSGGQAQRVSIARAMLKDSDIILLDEPTSSLDKETSKEVLESLDVLTKGKTVVHVTHQTDLLNGYDRIIRINEGRLYE